MIFRMESYINLAFTNRVRRLVLPQPLESPFFGPLSTEMGWLDTMDLTDSDCPILETSQAAVGTEYTSRRLSSPPAQWVRQRHRLAVLGDRESRKLEFVNQVCFFFSRFGSAGSLD